MTLALHAAEDLLSAIHTGRLPASAAAVDQALACLDKVSAWVDEFEASASLPSNAGDEARLIAERLRAVLSARRRKGRRRPSGVPPRPPARSRNGRRP
jgi:two-component system chemotaxis sensor kinase CheA